MRYLNASVSKSQLALNTPLTNMFFIVFQECLSVLKRLLVLFLIVVVLKAGETGLGCLRSSG